MPERELAEVGHDEGPGRRRLCDVLARRREDIVRRFVSVIRGGDLAPDGATRSQIVDHVPALLDEIAAAFAGVPRGQETHAVAPEHGRQRWEIGYPLAGLIHEYAILQRIISQVVQEEHADLSADEWGALSTCLIDHVAAAATAYSEYRDEELARERSAARARMEQSARVKDEFIAIVSHELRTPLTAILGWAAILRNPALSAVELHRGIDVIERNARAQTQIVSDLLDINRLVGGHLRIEFAPLDVAAVVAQGVDGIRPAAIAKDIALRVEVDGRDLGVRGDAGRLQQVVWNLVTNAVKFTPKGGHVVVSVARRGSDVAVVVLDDGIGITAEFMPHLFEGFRQSDASSARAHGGLGVGLWLAKELVELHGGSIRAASAGADRGSRFTVLFPIHSVAP